MDLNRIIHGVNPISEEIHGEFLDNLKKLDFVKVEDNEFILYRWDDLFSIQFIDNDEENIKNVLDYYENYQKELLQRVESRAVELVAGVTIPKNYSEEITNGTRKLLDEIMRGKNEFAGWLLPEPEKDSEGNYSTEPGNTFIVVNFTYVIAVEVDNRANLRGYVDVWPWLRQPPPNNEIADRVGEKPLCEYMIKE